MLKERNRNRRRRDSRLKINAKVLQTETDLYVLARFLITVTGMKERIVQ